MYRGDPTTGAPFIFLMEPPVTPTSPAGPGYQDLNKANGSGHLKPRPAPPPQPQPQPQPTPPTTVSQGWPVRV